MAERRILSSEFGESRTARERLRLLPMRYLRTWYFSPIDTDLHKLSVLGIYVPPSESSQDVSYEPVS